MNLTNDGSRKRQALSSNFGAWGSQERIERERVGKEVSREKFIAHIQLNINIFKNRSLYTAIKTNTADKNLAKLNCKKLTL